ncbi:MAG: TetR/AcrR family transcriptional regulator [Bacteroidia bacterium]|nr:TetR/AcrR family transcriptional regulator [Bacteroidia bacterium]
MQKREEKKQLILHAATECFSRNGYEKTTLDDIGGRVSLNKASLYYYYSSKEDLFCDVIYSEAHRFREEVRNKIKNMKGVEPKIVFFLTERARFYRKLRHLHDLTLNLVRRIEPIFLTLQHSIRAEERSLLQDVINEGVVTGEIRKTESVRLAEVLLKIASVSRRPALALADDYSGHGSEESEDVEMLDDIQFTTKLILQGVRLSAG